jgi:aminoglycoside/choline kinase family phosphotransferase
MAGWPQAEGGKAMTTDTALNPAPTLSAEILDPAWLKAHVYPHYPDLVITGTTEVWRQENTATKLRVTVEVENAPADMVRTIFIKGMLDESGAPWIRNGVSGTEANFYADLAPVLRTAGLRLPPCLYTGIDPANGHGLIVLQDMVPEGAEFLTALTPYSAMQARDSLSELARLHAGTGPETLLGNYPLTGMTLATMAQKSMIPLDMLQELLDGPRSDPLPPYLRDAKLLHGSLGKLVARFDGQPTCIVHGDAHAGNLYRHEGGAGIIDWQLPQHGHWALDVAYHICAALTVEDRRAHERELLAHYVEQRAALGAPVANPDTSFADYGAATLYGFYLWGITRRVQQDIIFEFVKRLGLAVDDHGSMRGL